MRFPSAKKCSVCLIELAFGLRLYVTSFQELLKLRYLAINYRSFCTIVDKYMERLLRKGQIQSEHLPLVVFEMPALSVLDLEETKINCLPRTCVSKLRELYLAKNYLQVNSIMTHGTFERISSLVGEEMSLNRSLCCIRS